MTGFLRTCIVNEWYHDRIMCKIGLNSFQMDCRGCDLACGTKDVTRRWLNQAGSYIVCILLYLAVVSILVCVCLFLDSFGYHLARVLGDASSDQWIRIKWPKYTRTCRDIFVALTLIADTREEITRKEIVRTTLRCHSLLLSKGN